MSFGRSRAKLYDRSREAAVTFDDVAGVDDAKSELAEVIQFLRDPGRYGAIGARVPKGVLLVGPPGTGKTLLARAVAGEAAVPFFSLSGSEFVEMFVGVGAARVRDLCEQAKSRAPCIVFIDELDAVGKTRAGAAGFVANEEREQTLNQLLVEMDGFDSGSGLILARSCARAVSIVASWSTAPMCAVAARSSRSTRARCASPPTPRSTWSRSARRAWSAPISRMSSTRPRSPRFGEATTASQWSTSRRPSIGSSSGCGVRGA
jgi:hypothetical protein